MKLRKLTEAEFNTLNEEACTETGKKPTVRVYDGNVPVRLTFDNYDLTIAAGEYKSLVFVPCELIGEHNWIRGFDSKYVVGLKQFMATKGTRGWMIDPAGPRTSKVPAGEYKIIELENNGVLFAFC